MPKTQDTFTPIFDGIVQDVGLACAAVFGRMWRYCQGDRQVCQASKQSIAESLDLTTRTVIRHQKTLLKQEYIEDLTPDLRNKPHTYRMTAKAFTMTKCHTKEEEACQNDSVGVTECHSQSDKMSHEETIEETTKKQEHVGEAPSVPDVPVNFQGWQQKIKESKNRQAVLRGMIETLYPGLDPPSFAYVTKTAKRIGSAGRMGDLLWQCSSHPPTGDICAYILAIAKKGNGHGAHSRGNGGSLPPPPPGRDSVEEIQRKLAERISQGG